MSFSNPIVISHIAFQVANLEQSTIFYQDVIGLHPLEEPFKMGRHSWFALGAACQLHLISGAESPFSFHLDHHLAMSTPDLELFMQKLEAAGIPYYDAKKTPGTVHVRPDGIRQVFFQDPDGYWLEMNNEFPVPKNPV